MPVRSPVARISGIALVTVSLLGGTAPVLAQSGQAKPTANGVERLTEKQWAEMTEASRRDPKKWKYCTKLASSQKLYREAIWPFLYRCM